jgi:hypothetical protein
MFWEGFNKKAAVLGIKSLKPLSSSGRLVGNKPSSMVTTISAVKKNPLPTLAKHSPAQISGPKLSTSGTMNTVPKAKRKASMGVGETKI